MSCQRAFDIDLAAFLADPRAEDFAAFREHYPRCRACAAEVRAWTDLGARLGADRAHVEPRLLLAYDEAPTRLAPDERLRVSAHLALCASCRDELAALGGFDPVVLGAPSSAAPSEPRPVLAAPLHWLRRLLWHPGFAYTLALLVTAPALTLWLTSGDRVPRESPAIAGEERARAPLAEGAVRTEERPREAPLAPEPSLGLAFERKDAPEPGVVAGGTPSAAAARSPLGLRFSDEGEPAELRSEALRALGYVEPGAPAAESEPSAGGSAPTVSLEDLGGGLFALRVPADPAARKVEIRVISPDGRRELVQRFEGGTSEVELQIPAGWLEPGPQRVERRLDDRMEVFSLRAP
jgi:hypothetical protein